ncbi:hypothetical protein DASC09_032700 [Saccharomycopsis crataegensis]|uniref:Uncharacterized protein n=1 Tax=Saccharomycopsis crataegensis TaxID=43959 RepID=A0AAV5QNP9_9ASCO|nr:hypothetical protein DASC09_032700 [Saccharomycopsis crataegensis]
MPDPKPAVNHNWLKEIRGLPSLQSYNLLNETKTTFVGADHLNDVKTIDKLTSKTRNLKDNVHQMEAVFEKRQQKIEDALNNLEWLNQIK